MGQSGMMRPGRSPALPSCSVPALPGTLVDVTLADMHGMMGAGHDGPVRHDGGALPERQPGRADGNDGMMRIAINPATVPPGQVSFRVTNNGALNHELVILPPLARGGQYPGQRAVGPDGTVGEAGSVGGEASRTCGADKGDENTDNPGIAPGGQWLDHRESHAGTLRAYLQHLRSLLDRHVCRTGRQPNEITHRHCYREEVETMAATAANDHQCRDPCGDRLCAVGRAR